MTLATRAPVRSPALPRLLAGLGLGLLLAMAFPPVNLLAGWVAVPAVALLLAAFRGLRWSGGAALGVAAGAGFFLPLLSWMRVLGPDAWLVLGALCIAFWAAMGAGLPWLLGHPGWMLTVPLAWTVQEAARERIPFGGFPWGRLAFAQADTTFVGWGVLGGPALVTFAVALAATCLLRGLDWAAGRVTRRRSSNGRPDPGPDPRPGAWPGPAAGPGGAAAVVAVLGLALLALGGWALLRIGWGGPQGPTQPIAIVQGNVPRLGLDFNAQRRAVLDNHVRVTEQLARDVAQGRAAQPVAVIWPENSSDIDPLVNADAAAQIDRAARAIDAPILVGAVMDNPADPATGDDPGSVLNVGLVWSPTTGPGEAYVKRHPVPFGEYLPFRDVLTRFITRFERIPRDFAGGDEPGFLMVGPVPAGVVICFETAYDELVRDAVRAGGQVLVVQTNNATYGGTGQPEQQLAISRVQAVAAGRTTLVAATSGISAVIDPDGALAWRTAQFTADRTVVEVPMRQGLTPFVRLGGLPELAALLLLVAAVGALAAVDRRERAR